MKVIIALRPLLWIDAATCAAMGLLLVLCTDALSDILGLPSALVREVGIILLPFGLFVAWAALRPEPRRSARIVIAANVAWVVGSFALLAGPWVTPSPLGAAFVAVQAIAVAAITALELAAAARNRAAA